MLCRLTALALFVCGWRAAVATQDTEAPDRRLQLVEVERSRSHLAAAEAMLADLQAEIERTEGPGLRLAMALRERGLLLEDGDRSGEAIPLYERAAAMVRAQKGASPVVLGLVLGNLAVRTRTAATSTRPSGFPGKPWGCCAPPGRARIRRRPWRFTRTEWRCMACSATWRRCGKFAGIDGDLGARGQPGLRASGAGEGRNRHLPGQHGLQQPGRGF